MKQIEIVTAMTKDRVIGANGKLPWDIHEEMLHFVRLTKGATVIMGKNTWMSLDDKHRPLPGRINIVVSTTLEPQEGMEVYKTVNEAVASAQKHGRDIYCIGGAKLYESMLPLAGVLHISWIKGDYSGDTYFPEINFKKWEEAEREDSSEFIYIKYLRKN